MLSATPAVPKPLTSDATMNSDSKAVDTESERKERLHEEWRSIIMLLMLTSGLNHKGHSTLRHSEDSYATKEVLDSSEPHAVLALNALAAISVRDTEIVAVVAHDAPRWHVSVVANSAPLGKDYGDGGDYGSISGFVANPDTQDAEFKPSIKLATQDLRLTTGKSEWHAVVKDPMHWLRVLPREAPLCNYIATIFEYVNAGQKEAGSHAMEVLLKAVVAFCWRKMYRQAGGWSSLGRVFHLNELKKSTVEACADDWVHKHPFISKPSGRLDHKLAKELKNVQPRNWQAFWDALPKSQNSQLVGKPFPHLQDACLQKNGEAAEEMPYSKELSWDFHLFLIALLLLHGRMLRDLWNEDIQVRKEGKADDRLRKLALGLFATSFILYRVAHSQILQHHLQALRPYLVEPEVGMVQAYYSFADINQPDWRTNELQLQDAQQDNVQGGMEDSNEVEAEVHATALESDQHNPEDQTAQVWGRWIRLLVVHVTAVHVLTTFSGRLKAEQEVDFSVFAIPPLEAKELRSSSWDKCIINVYQAKKGEIDANPADRGPKATKAISIVNKYLELDSSLNWIPDFPIYKLFRAAKQNQKREIAFPGNLHCEAALTCLTKYGVALDPKDGQDWEKVQRILETSQNTKIAVSKLCSSCPVCWELLKFLSDGEDKYQARGYHTTITPVELPRGLPGDIMQRMVDKFRGYLRTQLNKLPEPPLKRQGHGRTDSGQSAGNISEANSEGNDDSSKMNIRRVRYTVRSDAGTTG
ncbi:hypothetical protein EW146_g9313 [Bondarzewia mesenterica]|uniref:Uncharacterized protein n=1 Tax=Bondarzewia mesenterica TaxID=1095465 RepID=A0A4S4L999_9AGAM|nr:hypothetical protein EW146_g9313 [Bondarzewia mesenterica]